MEIVSPCKFFGGPIDGAAYIMRLQVPVGAVPRVSVLTDDSAKAGLKHVYQSAVHWDEGCQCLRLEHVQIIEHDADPYE